MKVKQLVKKLLKMDQELEVWLNMDDGDDTSWSTPCDSVQRGHVDDDEDVCLWTKKNRKTVVVLL